MCLLVFLCVLVFQQKQTLRLKKKINANENTKKPHGTAVEWYSDANSNNYPGSYQPMVQTSFVPQSQQVLITVQSSIYCYLFCLLFVL